MFARRAIGWGGGDAAVPARDARSENFPVAARLLPGHVRAQVLAFYGYARAADDVADDPATGPEAKLAALDAFEAGLDGRAGSAPAMALRAAVGGDAALLAPARALLGAFRQDAAGAAYRSWDDLEGYCAMSAVPVGRFLLALHGEGKAPRQCADPLCTALQVLNHLQDLRADRDRLGRVYLPADWLAEAGAGAADLSRARVTPAVRAAIDRALDQCDACLLRAAPLPRRIRARGLRGQAAATLHLARRLSARLRARDPLAGRVAPSRADFARAALAGLRAAAGRAP